MFLQNFVYFGQNVVRKLLHTHSLPVWQKRILLQPPTGVTNAQMKRSFLRYLGDDAYAGTMADLKEAMMKDLGLERGYQHVHRSREHLLKYEPKREDLPPRSMQDSFTSAIIPLSTDKELQDRYITILGGVRLAKLMEDMDLFAVWVCHKYLKIPNLPADVHLPYTFVTILLDKVTFTDVRTKATEDIRLSGHVSHVGRSSMEVVVRLEQMHAGVYSKITRAIFLMAARNATNTAAVPVNPLVPATEEEQKIFDGGEGRRQRRLAVKATSITKVPPTSYEQFLMYDLFKRTTPITTIELNRRVLPSNCRWMADTLMKNTILSYPFNRNAHNTVFGGFLLHIALETSHVTACLYSRSRPTLQHICDISFEKPVSVNSFIKVTSYVVYTEKNYMQVKTVADVLDGINGDQVTTNVFYHTYMASQIVPEVLPKSYHETTWYIQGRRKFRYAMDLE